MAKVIIKLNRAGVRALLKSQDIAAACEKVAKAEAAKLGDSYKTNVYQGGNRVNVSIYTEDPAAIADNLKNNALLKSMGAKQPRTGKQVKGYWRTGKNGKKIWVEPYQRRK